VRERVWEKERKRNLLLKVVEQIEMSKREEKRRKGAAPP
jgi:hypothetical protein